MDSRGGQDRNLNPLRAFGAVFWAFLGIRKGAASQSDAASLKLWQVVVAGVIGTACFVAIIVTTVSVITG